VLRPREITALLTSAAGPRIAPSLTPDLAVEIASLADITILLRDFEHGGEVRRAIAVVQARGTAHDHRIRQVDIDGLGMHIGEPLHGASRALFATPLVPEQPQRPAEPR
jgi:circadian clock protein KaiC